MFVAKEKLILIFRIKIRPHLCKVICNVFMLLRMYLSRHPLPPPFTSPDTLHDFPHN